MEDLKRKWEDWYADLMTHYEWSELEFNGRNVLYVCGAALIDCDGRGMTSELVQVIGYVDCETALGEDERGEIAQLLKSRHGIENVSFWSS